jgi:hypothetical protein
MEMERGRWEGQNFQLKEVQRLEKEEEEKEEVSNNIKFYKNPSSGSRDDTR